MIVDEDLFKKYLRPAFERAIKYKKNWDHEACIAAANDERWIVCSVPSVIQHIGFNSSMNHIERPDTADDFKELRLENVTLIGVDCVNVDRLIEAARLSCQNISFGAVKMLSSEVASHMFADCCEMIKIDPIKSKEQYSEFIIRDLDRYVDTEYALVIQYDGYVVNHRSWHREFLNYDYVGATWWYRDGKNVGNGGFSLRSKKLLSILAKDPEIKLFHPEDHHICRTYRTHLERQGIEFASDAVADKFSMEGHNNNKRYTNQFGFHGYKADVINDDNKKTFIINQFQGLGDILFMMPMIDEWIKQGYKIIWPVVPQYLDIQKHFPNVHFVNRNHLGIDYASKEFKSTPYGKVLPLRFSDSICKVPYKDCMKSKYMLFDADWNMWRQLKWHRDVKQEEKLFYEVLGLKDGEKYTLINRNFRTNGSGKSPIPLVSGTVIQMASVEGYTLLDWGKVIENADIIHTVGTSINYVIEILDCKAREIHLYIRRPEESNFSYYDYVLTEKYNYIFHK